MKNIYLKKLRCDMKKLTLTEFLNSKDEIGILCRTHEYAIRLFYYIEERRLKDRHCFMATNNIKLLEDWLVYRFNSVYTNRGFIDSLSDMPLKYQVYSFNDIDLER